VTGPGFSAGLSPHRRPVGAMTAHGTGERLATSAATPSARSGQVAPSAPPAGQQQPAAAPATSASPRPAGSNGGGITVPPLPPIAGQGANRRPLSSEDFEEELDIPEFLKG
jgi:cell division protein FtsZ